MAVGLALSILSVAGITGCGADLLDPPPPDDLQFYLLLSPTPADDSISFQPAFLLRQPGPLRLEYATADEFRLTRALDGRAFSVRHMDRKGSAIERSLLLSPSQANYIIPRDISDSLGVRDLEPGVSYKVRVSVDGRLIRGTTQVPERLDPSVVERADGRYLVWSRSDGAGGYRVTVLGSATPDPVVTTDTLLRLPTGTDEVVMEAFDINAFRYVTDASQEISAGIEGAAGLFGSVVRARIRLDE